MVYYSMLEGNAKPSSTKQLVKYRIVALRKLYRIRWIEVLTFCNIFDCGNINLEKVVAATHSYVLMWVAMLRYEGH